ncbi:MULTISPECIES: hypothetical protein [Glutamicibacter]|uniref:Uncharacterized protein n=2 Tax=Glutamicibacter arilaitensis TaxID=256701 RepID=A0A4Y8TYR9_9MICC|nr:MULTISPECIES: hypothetical protein [Glutamicibacter]TFH57018.1 hypothetical protein EXY26_08455 [Glutamicibacter arilaitensis]CBT76040.1 hypothetical protein AARI_18240 [Glutamicibacter arilaitensis Re117]HCH48244.1 hypothetical protein [Glutamicibacter sp.]HCJ54867.1 hypothetical protein [Glutamicibacter sp.]HCM95941.1 hypothetical protein [Glutamicibacter sp.]
MLEYSNDGADKYFSHIVGPITDHHQVVRIGSAEQQPLEASAPSIAGPAQNAASGQSAMLAQDSLDDWF